MAIKEIGQSAVEVGFQADPGLIKNSDGETVIAVTADKKVGIGTTTPATVLDVVGGITATSGNDGAGTIAVRSGDASQYSKISMGTNANKATIGCPGASDTFFTDTAAGDLVLRADDNNNKVHIGAGASGAAQLVVTEHSGTDPRIGIGTASPDRALEILDASNPQLRLTHTDDTHYSEMQTTATGNLLAEGSHATNFYKIARASTNAYSVYQAGASQVSDGASKGLSVGVTGTTAYIWMRGTGSNGALNIGAGGTGGLSIDADNDIVALEGTFQLKAEQDAPSAPPSGEGGIFYVKSDGIPYYISDSTAETSLVGGGGIATTGATLITADPSPAVAGTMYLCDSASAFNVTLPTAAAAGNGGTVDVCKASGANDVTVLRAASDTINGATSQLVSVLYSNITLVSDGTDKWWIR